MRPGDTFHFLTVVGKSAISKGRIECQCKCGNIRHLPARYLVHGICKSCGCRKKLSKHSTTHGHTCNGKISSTYRSWAMMIQRCTNKKFIEYPNYGGRGISVCARWLLFANFLADMGEKPSPKYSIERKNTNGDYTPTNCRWATMREQQNNRRNNRRITLNGESHTIAEWSRIVGIKPQTILHRLNANWTPEKTLLSKPNHSD